MKMAMALVATSFMTPAVHASTVVQPFYSDFQTGGSSTGPAILPQLSSTPIAVSFDFISDLTEIFLYGIPEDTTFSYTGQLGVDVIGSGSFSLTKPISGQFTCLADEFDCSLSISQTLHFDLTPSQIASLVGNSEFFVGAVGEVSLNPSWLPRDYSSSSAQGTITYTFADAVPEPASWAMMLAGFGILGSGLRRRDRLKTNFAF